MILSPDDLDRLAAGRWVVRDGVIGRPLPVLDVLAADAQPAGTGRDAVQSVVRSDRIVWLEPSPDLAPLTSLFDGLQQQLNREFFGLERYELQLALYRPGSRYARHRDAFRGTMSGRGRRLTAIWYANPGWTEADGGALRLWDGDVPTDVLPVLDRLVVFESERWDHEVLPPVRPRLAVTAWYHGREDLPV